MPKKYPVYKYEVNYFDIDDSGLIISLSEITTKKLFAIPYARYFLVNSRTTEYIIKKEDELAFYFAEQLIKNL